MPKILIISILSVLIAAPQFVQAKTPEIILTKQITLDEREQIPDKTMEVKMSQLKFNTKEQPALVQQLGDLLDYFADNFFANDVFAFCFAKVNDSIVITINNCDIIDSIGTNPKQYFGDLAVKHCHFIVTQNPDCEKLFKKLFKSSGKINAIREFEYVAFKNPPYSTMAVATFGGEQLNINQLIINAEPPQEPDENTEPAHEQEVEHINLPLIIHQ
ncbi:MAG: hypothetical protein IK092_02130 [Muribaculaceae bacterium]|nr:hypothetical protein [Muribaculaceae bacterium]